MAGHEFAPPPLTTDEGDAWAPVGSGVGDVGGDRHFEGKTPSIGIWKCPACRAENAGPLELGCTACGSGKPGVHVGTAPPKPIAPRPEGRPASAPLMSADVERLTVMERAFVDWLSARSPMDTAGQEIAARAFEAGWIAGAQHQARRTMPAPPVTADVEQLAPEGKAKRTIAAALRLFKQELANTQEEITSGEWCTVEEIDALILQFEEIHD